MTTEENNNEQYVILWEAPKIIPPEFRLYYDDNGNVICYTCEKPEGNYIVIDKLTYAACRYDVRVINGKISTIAPNAVFYKLTPNNEEGIVTCSEDLSIIPDRTYDGETMKWKMTIYEL